MESERICNFVQKCRNKQENTKMINEEPYKGVLPHSKNAWTGLDCSTDNSQEQVCNQGPITL